MKKHAPGCSSADCCGCWPSDCPLPLSLSFLGGGDAHICGDHPAGTFTIGVGSDDYPLLQTVNYDPDTMTIASQADVNECAWLYYGRCTFGKRIQSYTIDGGGEVTAFTTCERSITPLPNSYNDVLAICTEPVELLTGANPILDSANSIAFMFALFGKGNETRGSFPSYVDYPCVVLCQIVRGSPNKIYVVIVRQYAVCDVPVVSAVTPACEGGYGEFGYRSFPGGSIFRRYAVGQTLDEYVGDVDCDGTLPTTLDFNQRRCYWQENNVGTGAIIASGTDDTIVVTDTHAAGSYVMDAEQASVDVDWDV